MEMKYKKSSINIYLNLVYTISRLIGGRVVSESRYKSLDQLKKDIIGGNEIEFNKY